MNLNLTLIRKWYDLTLSGVKKEEYREIKPYWINRLLQDSYPYEDNYGRHNTLSDMVFDAAHGYEWGIIFDNYQRSFKPFTTTTFTNGYGKHRPSFAIECKGIRIGRGNPEWGAPVDRDVFIIEHGKILSK